jgi:hypothetical protein
MCLTNVFLGQCFHLAFEAIFFDEMHFTLNITLQKNHKITKNHHQNNHWFIDVHICCPKFFSRLNECFNTKVEFLKKSYNY